ncbi:MAG: hypothetical protein ACPGOV_07970 [Magnetovibrionaceae bacterium]
MAGLIDESVAVALSQRGVRARTGAVESPDFRLKGKAMVSRGAPDGRVALIRWRLTDPDGHEIGSYVHDVTGRWERWEAGQADIIAQVARKAADPLAQLIPRPGSRTIVLREEAPLPLPEEVQAPAPELSQELSTTNVLPSTPLPERLRAPLGGGQTAEALASSPLSNNTAAGNTAAGNTAANNTAASKTVAGQSVEGPGVSAEPRSEVLARATEPLIPNPSLGTEFSARPVLEPRPPAHHASDIFDRGVNGATTSSISVPDGPAPRFTVFIDKIEGADTQGEPALRRALAVALRLQDLGIVQDRVGATARIVGRLDMAAPSNGLLPIQVNWEAFGINGDFLGRVNQQNRIPESALPRAWASVAAAIATNAAPSLRQLIAGPPSDAPVN